MSSIRAHLDELFASEQELGPVIEEVARLSVRLVIQAAVDAEVAEFLGRDRYARAGATVLKMAAATPSLRSTPPLGGGLETVQAPRHR